MANVHLPPRFKLKLETDQKLDGIIKTTLHNFGEILKDNKLFFFEEYTNHGIDHIESVIVSSDNLITDKTFNDILNEKDIGYYLLSVILHDIGMHLNIEGFARLMNGDFDTNRIRELDSLTWKELWEDYFSEAKKYSGKQLNAIFGDENFIIRTPPIEDSGNLNSTDKKLIGEFLRKNHPRLAHEIAIQGFPGSTMIGFADDIDQKDRYLIGLIARSHGLDLRKCVDNIENYYGRDSRKYPCNTHAAYLMVLLRNADYLQIDNHRTSKILLKLKTFSSPLSEAEHESHLSIDYLDYKYQDDPERIYVSASPKDSKMYLKLKKLISDIQYEFDISWAVLGELYGNTNDKLEIKYRRITSNLADKNFINKQEYVADQIAFKANDDIVKLLIAPLYGDDPKFGIRELLQNAIDACRERELLEKHKTNNNYLPSVEVQVVKENENFYFVINDNGIGMTIEIIKNYFLSAGASFRKSLDWQKEFTDEHGNSKIRRSGRFGVGVLATFLIGQEIHIESRNINSEFGYRFVTDINLEQINILKNNNLEFGTKIKIKITQPILEKLDPQQREILHWFDWYTLTTPLVKYYYLEKEIIPYTVLDPDFLDPIPLDWSMIDSPGYTKILWTYSEKFTESQFTCNGIVVFRDYGLPANALGLIDKRPKVSVFDNNGFLPLTLSRDSFTRDPTFWKELKIDIYKDFISYLLSFEPQTIIEGDLIYLGHQQLNYPNASFKDRADLFYGDQLYDVNSYNNYYYIRNFFNNFLLCKTGFTLNYNYFLKKLGSINVVFLNSDVGDFQEKIKLDLQESFFKFSDDKINSINDFIEALEPREFNYNTGEFEYQATSVFLKKIKYKFLFSTEVKRMSTYLKSLWTLKEEYNELVNITIKTPVSSVITEEFITQHSSQINFLREYKINCKYDGDPDLDILLKKYIGKNLIIPFSLAERKLKYPVAFKELKKYMEKYRNE